MRGNLYDASPALTLTLVLIFLCRAKTCQVMSLSLGGACFGTVLYYQCSRWWGSFIAANCNEHWIKAKLLHNNISSWVLRKWLWPTQHRLFLILAKVSKPSNLKKYLWSVCLSYTLHPSLNVKALCDYEVYSVWREITICSGQTFTEGQSLKTAILYLISHFNVVVNNLTNTFAFSNVCWFIGMSKRVTVYHSLIVYVKYRVTRHRSPSLVAMMGWSLISTTRWMMWLT